MPETPDPELTAEEARAMVDQLTYDLYRSDDARAWAREQCDIRDHQQQAAPGQGTVQTAEVLAWLQGPKCGRMLGTEVRSDTARDAEVEQLRATIARVQRLLDTGPVGTCCAHLVRAALDQQQTGETTL